MVAANQASAFRLPSLFVAEPVVELLVCEVELVTEAVVVGER